MARPLGLLIMAILASTAIVSGAYAEVPVVTDSRIKTFVYNENEVFTITTHYGYQSNIEFGAKETIDTISVGDRVAWQIIPAGRRLFIRAMEENAHTNMTIVTNQRAYQFDLRSSSADAVFGSSELTYVVRFYYPEEMAGGNLPVTYLRDVQPPAPVVATPPPAPVPTAAAPTPVPAMPSAMNYRYTYTGPDSAAPIRIYDDGRSTYFKFKGNAAPRIAVLTAKGEALDVPSHRTPDGLIAVDVVAPRFSVETAGQKVVVYNEANGVM